MLRYISARVIKGKGYVFQDQRRQDGLRRAYWGETEKRIAPPVTLCPAERDRIAQKGLTLALQAKQGKQRVKELLTPYPGW